MRARKARSFILSLVLCATMTVNSISALADETDSKEYVVSEADAKIAAEKLAAEKQSDAEMMEKLKVETEIVEEAVKEAPAEDYIPVVAEEIAMDVLCAADDLGFTDATFDFEDGQQYAIANPVWDAVNQVNNDNNNTTIVVGGSAASRGNNGILFMATEVNGQKDDPGLSFDLLGILGAEKCAKIAKVELAYKITAQDGSVLSSSDERVDNMDVHVVFNTAAGYQDVPIQGSNVWAKASVAKTTTETNVSYYNFVIVCYKAKWADMAISVDDISFYDAEGNLIRINDETPGTDDPENPTDDPVNQVTAATFDFEDGQANCDANPIWDAVNQVNNPNNNTTIALTDYAASRGDKGLVFKATELNDEKDNPGLSFSILDMFGAEKAALIDKVELSYRIVAGDGSVIEDAQDSRITDPGLYVVFNTAGGYQDVAVAGSNTWKRESIKKTTTETDITYYNLVIVSYAAKGADMAICVDDIAFYDAEGNLIVGDENENPGEDPGNEDPEDPEEPTDDAVNQVTAATFDFENGQTNCIANPIWDAVNQVNNPNNNTTIALTDYAASRGDKGLVFKATELNDEKDNPGLSFSILDMFGAEKAALIDKVEVSYRIVAGDGSVIEDAQDSRITDPGLYVVFNTAGGYQDVAVAGSNTWKRESIKKTTTETDITYYNLVIVSYAAKGADMAICVDDIAFYDAEGNLIVGDENENPGEDPGNQDPEDPEEPTDDAVNQVTAATFDFENGQTNCIANPIWDAVNQVNNPNNNTTIALTDYAASRGSKGLMFKATELNADKDDPGLSFSILDIFGAEKAALIDKVEVSYRIVAGDGSAIEDRNDSRISGASLYVVFNTAGGYQDVAVAGSNTWKRASVKKTTTETDITYYNFVIVSYGAKHSDMAICIDDIAFYDAEGNLIVEEAGENGGEIPEHITAGNAVDMAISTRYLDVADGWDSVNNMAIPNNNTAYFVSDAAAYCNSTGIVYGPRVVDPVRQDPGICFNLLDAYGSDFCGRIYKIGYCYKIMKADGVTPLDQEELDAYNNDPSSQPPVSFVINSDGDYAQKQPRLSSEWQYCETTRGNYGRPLTYFQFVSVNYSSKYNGYLVMIDGICFYDIDGNLMGVPGFVTHPYNNGGGYMATAAADNGADGVAVETADPSIQRSGTLSFQAVSDYTTAAGIWDPVNLCLIPNTNTSYRLSERAGYKNRKGLEFGVVQQDETLQDPGIKVDLLAAYGYDFCAKINKIGLYCKVVYPSGDTLSASSTGEDYVCYVINTDDGYTQSQPVINGGWQYVEVKKASGNKDITYFEFQCINYAGKWNGNLVYLDGLCFFDKDGNQIFVDDEDWEDMDEEFDDEEEDYIEEESEEVEVATEETEEEEITLEDVVLEAEQEEAVEVTKETVPVETEVEQSGSNVWIIIVIVCVVLAAGGAGAFVFLKKKKETK